MTSKKTPWLLLIDYGDEQFDLSLVQRLAAKEGGYASDHLMGSAEVSLPSPSSTYARLRGRTADGWDDRRGCGT